MADQYGTIYIQKTVTAVAWASLVLLVLSCYPLADRYRQKGRRGSGMYTRTREGYIEDRYL